MPARGYRGPVSWCAAEGCDRVAIALGLCRLHYKRQRAGKPLEPDPGPKVGSPSGWGRYGILESSADGQWVMCHECGDWFRSVGAHLARTGERQVREYRRAHGLPSGLGLVAPEQAAAASTRALDRVGSEQWRRLEAKRDPLAASNARTVESFTVRGSQVLERRVRGRSNGRRVLGQREFLCPVCGAYWCAVAGARQPMTCSPDCWRRLQSGTTKAPTHP